MALEDIIAQRIAVASQARARMDASNFGLIPLREDLRWLSQMNLQREQERRAREQGDASLALSREQLEQRQREFAATQAPEPGVPEPIARLAAEGVVPEAAQAPDMGAAAGYAPGLPMVSGALEVRRRGQVDALVSALGAEGGAKFLATLVAYTQMDMKRKEVAAERLGLSVKMIGAVEEEARKREAHGFARGREERAEEDAARQEAEARAKAAQKEKDDAWWGQYGPQFVKDPAQLPAEAVASMPTDLRKTGTVQAGVESRFQRGQALTRERFEEAKREWETIHAEARADKAAGRLDQSYGRLNTLLIRIGSEIDQNLDANTRRPLDKVLDAELRKEQKRLMDEMAADRVALDKAPVPGVGAGRTEDALDTVIKSLTPEQIQDILNK